MQCVINKIVTIIVNMSVSVMQANTETVETFLNSEQFLHNPALHQLPNTAKDTGMYLIIDFERLPDSYKA